MKVIPGNGSRCIFRWNWGENAFTLSAERKSQTGQSLIGGDAVGETSLRLRLAPAEGLANPRGCPPDSCPVKTRKRPNPTDYSHYIRTCASCMCLPFPHRTPSPKKSHRAAFRLFSAILRALTRERRHTSIDKYLCKTLFEVSVLSSGAYWGS